MYILGTILIILSAIGLAIFAAKHDWFENVVLTIAGIWCMIVWPILKQPVVTLGLLLFTFGLGVVLIFI